VVQPGSSATHSAVAVSITCHHGLPPSFSLPAACIASSRVSKEPAKVFRSPAAGAVNNRNFLIRIRYPTRCLAGFSGAGRDPECVPAAWSAMRASGLRKPLRTVAGSIARRCRSRASTRRSGIRKRAPPHPWGSGIHARPAATACRPATPSSPSTDGPTCGCFPWSLLRLMRALSNSHAARLPRRASVFCALRRVARGGIARAGVGDRRTGAWRAPYRHALGALFQPFSASLRRGAPRRMPRWSSRSPASAWAFRP
jgi:hypothetical protein